MFCPFSFALPRVPRSRAFSRRGFTLTEILVVMVVITLLAAFLFPALMKARENARRAACQSNLKQIGLAIMQYTQDFDETMPMRYSGAETGDDDLGTSMPAGDILPGSDMDRAPLNWRVLLHPYVKSTQSFSCPSNPNREKSATDLSKAPEGTPDMPISYACNYNSGSGLGTFGNETGLDRVTMSSMEFPSETIAVTETTSPRPDIDMDDLRLFGSLYAGHTGFSNYLFTDGHVKALRPLQTYFRGEKIVNMWQRDHTEFPRE